MKILLAALMPLVAVACTPLAPLPSVSALTAPADAARNAPHARSGPVVAYDAYRVTDPSDWRKVNDAQAGK